jgi:RAB protein geranylgeranyltransferase component A
MEQGIVLEPSHYRAMIFGTGLLESLLSTALAYKGYSSVNFDKDISYSSAMKTCSMKEFRQIFSQILPTETNRAFKFVKWIDNMSEEEIKQNTRGYNIDLQPRFLYSRSPTVDKMIEAGMDKYMDFKAITGIFFLNE